MQNNNFYYALCDQIMNISVNMSKIKAINGDSPDRAPDSYYPFYACGGQLLPSGGTSGDGYVYGGLLIGSGSTPATVNDYKLENQIKTGFSAIAAISNDNNSIASARQLLATTTITNTSSSDLVINEVGYARKYANGSIGWTVLLDRIVLDTPVTIAPNKTRTFEYRLKMPQQ